MANEIERTLAERIESVKLRIFRRMWDKGERCDVESLIELARAEGAELGLDMAQRWIDRELIQGRHVISLPKDVLLDAVLAPKEEK